MKNIHILPTNKRSKLATKDSNNKLEVSEKNTFFVNGFGFTTQNIYITNDEEIKERDWFIDNNNSLKRSYKLSHVQFANPKKIILTTDQSLDGVQAIDDEFLEWFVKNPNCEEVKVRQNPKVKAVVKGLGIKSFNNGYRIVIPKSELASKLKEILDNMSQEEFDEEWKKVTDLKLEGPSIIQHVELINKNIDEFDSKVKEFNEKQKQALIDMMKLDEEAGLYEQIDQNNPVTKGSTALVYKKETLSGFEEGYKANLDWLEQNSNQTKQETLEEAAEEFAKNHSIYPTAQDDTEYGFRYGAKWQQERSYSEEEVLEILDHHTSYLETFIYQYIDRQDIEVNEEWLKQFRKEKL